MTCCWLLVMLVASAVLLIDMAQPSWQVVPYTSLPPLYSNLLNWPGNSGFPSGTEFPKCICRNASIAVGTFSTFRLKTNEWCPDTNLTDGIIKWSDIYLNCTGDTVIGRHSLPSPCWDNVTNTIRLALTSAGRAYLDVRILFSLSCCF